MNKLYAFLLFSFLHILGIQSLSSQSMSVTSGVGITNFFDIIKDDHLVSDYGMGESYFLKIDISNGQSSSLFSDFAFKIEKQSGDVNYSSNYYGCGLGFPSGLLFANEQIEKYTLSVISYPISFSITNGIRLKAGIAAKKSLHIGAQSNNPTQKNNDDINFKSSIGNNDYGVDAAFELQLGNFSMGNGFLIAPVYNVFASLSEEFQGDYNTYSIRQSLGFSVLWGLKKK